MWLFAEEGESEAETGGGRQATHIAERMGGSGSVTACDRSAHKVGKIEQLARRLRLDTVLVLPPLWSCMCSAQFWKRVDRSRVDDPFGNVTSVGSS